MKIKIVKKKRVVLVKMLLLCITKYVNGSYLALPLFVL